MGLVNFKDSLNRFLDCLPLLRVIKEFFSIIDIQRLGNFAFNFTLSYDICYLGKRLSPCACLCSFLASFTFSHATHIIIGSLLVRK